MSSWSKLLQQFACCVFVSRLITCCCSGFSIGTFLGLAAEVSVLVVCTECGSALLRSLFGDTSPGFEDVIEDRGTNSSDTFPTSKLEDSETENSNPSHSNSNGNATADSEAGANTEDLTQVDEFPNEDHSFCKSERDDEIRASFKSETEENTTISIRTFGETIHVLEDSSSWRVSETVSSDRGDNDDLKAKRISTSGNSQTTNENKTKFDYEIRRGSINEIPLEFLYPCSPLGSI